MDTTHTNGRATTDAMASAHTNGGPHPYVTNGTLKGGVVNGKGASVASEEDEEGEVDHRCGLCCCYPQCLQPLAKPLVYLVCICALVFVQSMVVSGYTSAILTTIESRYELRSSELGLIISAYDIASLVAGVFVSYLGGTRHRTRWLGTGAIFIAIGSVCFTLPYFLGNTYYAQSSANGTSVDNNLLCSSGTTILSSEDNCDEKSPERWAMVIFIIAFLIIGFGASPVYSLGPTYLYDNVKPSKFPVYAGEKHIEIL